MDKNKHIVISAINFTEGGPLSVYIDFLTFISKKYGQKYHITAFVHSSDLFNIDNIDFLSLPSSKKSWLLRLYFEYIYFYFYSLNKNIFLWFSFHDVTPNVKAAKRIVYCHNPSIFYKGFIKPLRYEIKFIFFKFFYKFIYSINLDKNDFVVVQQNWIKDYFLKNFKLCKPVVVRPSLHYSFLNNISLKKNNVFQFFYPAFPRFFKNFEVICEAVQILSNNGILNFDVILTISGDENFYSRMLYKKYSHLKSIKFVGKKTREEVLDFYSLSNALIFPSTLETWGLPISEFKQLKKPILLSDLPYAHETIGEYEFVKFFDPNDANLLSTLMQELIYTYTLKFDISVNNLKDIDFFDGWSSFLNKVLSNEA